MSPTCKGREEKTRKQSCGFHKTETHLTALPQAVVDMPRCNFNTWVKENGGILKSAGTFREKQHYIMIGAGVGNLFLSAHLLLAGARVTLLEASSKVGGRAEQYITQSGEKAPLGMMRFGRGQALWVALMQEFDFYLKPGFPDPGKVPTVIAYGDNRRVWMKPDQFPDIIKHIAEDFESFLENGFEDLVSWNTLRSWLQNPWHERIDQAVQCWYDRFGGYTLQQFIMEIFQDQWSAEDFKIFDILGAGSGGLGPFNDLSFSELMRIIVNGNEDDQGSIGYYDHEGCLRDSQPQCVIEKLKEKVIQLGGDIRLKRKVTEINVTNADKIKIFTNADETFEGDHAVIGTTLPAVQKIQGVQNLVRPEVWEAICNHETISATKCFIECNVENIPEIHDADFCRCILSDGLSPHTYLLPSENKNNVLVLAFYGWGDVARKFDDYSHDQIVKAMTEAILVAISGTRYADAWVRILDPNNRVDSVVKKWDNDPHALTAFPKPGAGQEQLMKDLSYAWWSNQTKQGPLLEIIGDFFAGCGGWCDAPVMNALCVLSSHLKRYGDLNAPQSAPVNLLNPDILTYSCKSISCPRPQQNRHSPGCNCGQLNPDMACKQDCHQDQECSHSQNQREKYKSWGRK